MPALRVLGGDTVEKINKIKQTQRPDLHVYGSANLVQTLLGADLVDALWLKIYPLTLGSGKRLFADGTIPGGVQGDGEPSLPKRRHYRELRGCRRGKGRISLLSRLC
ncbi:hypothetical protein BH20ACI2_BH20ACI2_13850 [soil metagenome]